MNNKISKLKSLFGKYGIDYYIVPSQDEFLGEYTTEHTNRLKYISGFTGSNGLAIFSKEGPDYFYTDGRYLIQAKKQLGSKFEILDMVSTPVLKTLQELCKSGARIGIDAKMHGVLQVKKLMEELPSNSLVCLDKNLVDEAWDNRPARFYSDIFLYDVEHAGESTMSKRGRVIEAMTKKNVDTFVITDPHAVCWLLNIRGHDLDYTPLVLSRAILYKDGRVSLYCSNAYDEKIKEYFELNSIFVFKEEEFVYSLQNIESKNVAISTKSSYWVKEQVIWADIKPDYCDMLKACKNKAEIRGTIDAHIEDGKAVSSLIEWIYKQLDARKTLSEIDVSDKVLALRKKGKNFVCPSFPTIAGFKDNGAIVHYIPSKDSSKKIYGNGLLLIDSGGQYLGGTTDITRTIAIGTPTAEQKHDFTLVLKGAIRVSMAKFEEGTTGAELDVLARQDLAAEGKDYSHGTGHGVGNFLSVHEGPQSISKASSVALRPGMIISIEPGFYKEGSHGIRIENLAYVKESSEEGKLEFEILTRVPIQEELVDFSMLTEKEKLWLREYNANT